MKDFHARLGCWACSMQGYVCLTVLESYDRQTKEKSNKTQE